MDYFARVGLMAQVGRFESAEALCYPLGTRVVIRTDRGLELGEVLGSESVHSGRTSDGLLLRAATEADELLALRLEKNRLAACEACAKLLADQGSQAVLLDAEYLFDGKKLFFYFLGETDPIAERLTAELAAAYDTEARFEQFAETLSEGCGPGCGTPEAAGGGCSGSCASCSVAKACAPSSGG